MAAIAVLACGDPSGPPDEADGSVTFGHDQGQFSAAGHYVSGASGDDKLATTWAFGFLNPSDRNTVIEAHIARADGLSDQALIVLDRQRPGSSAVGERLSIYENCAPFFGISCTRVEALFSTTSDPFNDDAAVACYLAEGTVTLTSLTETRAVGTFSGTGFCVTSAGGYPWAVQSGTFDVGMVAHP